MQRKHHPKIKLCVQELEKLKTDVKAETPMVQPQIVENTQPDTSAPVANSALTTPASAIAAEAQADATAQTASSDTDANDAALPVSTPASSETSEIQTSAQETAAPAVSTVGFALASSLTPVWHP